MGTQQYFIGLDLGQAQEFTAIAVVEKTRFPRHPVTRVQPDPTYAVRHLERFPLGTSYPEIVRRVQQMYAKPPLRGSKLVVDQTGVGNAVVELLRTLHGSITMIPVTIVAGLAATPDGHGGWLIPKKDLVGEIQILLQTRRLTIAESLPDAALLVNELMNFQIKPKAATSTDPIADWREGVQDDLVFAVGIAVWQAERYDPWEWWLGRPEIWGGGW